MFDRLLDYLRKISVCQTNSMSLALSFPSLVNELRKSFIVIPTQQKKPCAKFLTEEDKKKANKRKVENEGALLLPPNLAVLDIDDTERFCAEFGITEDELKKIATIKTGRGYHIYIFDERDELKPFKNTIFELVKGQNELVILPGSRLFHEKLQKNVTYEVLNPKIYTQEELLTKNPNFERVLAVIRNGVTCACTQDNQEIMRNQVARAQNNGNQNTRKIDLEILKNVLNPHYIKGQRQFLVMYVAGLLAKAGFSEQEALTFVEELAIENHDEEKKMRLAAVRETYEKYGNGQEIKGLEGLRELGIDVSPAFVKKTIPKKKTHIPDNFVIVDGYVYYKKKTQKRKEELQMVGPAIKFEARLIEEKTDTNSDMDVIAYLVSYENRQAILKDPKDTSAIFKFTGKAVVKEAKFREWLNYQTDQVQKQIYYRKTTGWTKDNVFLHPCIQEKDWWDHFFTNKGLAVIREKDKQHEFVVQVLQEGKILGVLYTLSTSSILLKPLGGTPFCVFVTGPSGVGKTLACRLALNLFYDHSSFYFTAYATFTGLELALKSIRDLPILIDEITLKEVDLEKIVFMVASRIGKLRGTKHLSLNFHNLHSNVFFTSEIVDYEEFKRVGSHRRILALSVANWKDFTEIADLQTCKKYLKYVGAGIDYIKFLMQNTHVFKELHEQLDNYTAINPTMSEVVTSVFGTISFLEKFYGQNFRNLRLKTMEIFKEVYQEFLRKGNMVERFLEEFPNFLLQNNHRIYIKGGNEPLYEIIGEQDGDNYYILTNIFHNFARTQGFEVKVLIKELIKAGILQPYNERWPRKIKRILKKPASVYHLILNRNNDINN